MASRGAAKTMISIKQLRYFDAVARLGHFGKAAEHCGVTQPALSMQVQELEAELGLVLVERRAKGIALTDAGGEVALRASRILAEVRDLGDFARSGREPLSGPLRLGVIPSVAPYLLPPLLPALSASHPNLDFHIRETQTNQLVVELLAGTLDVLVLALPEEHPEIETLGLVEDRFLLALPASRKLPHRVRATLDLIAGDRLLLLEEGHCLRDQALAVCELRRSDQIDTFGASSLSTIVQMVANGLGLTLLPEIAVPLETRGTNVRLVRFAEPEPSRTLGLAWRRSSPRKSEFELFGKRLLEAMPKERVVP